MTNELLVKLEYALKEIDTCAKKLWAATKGYQIFAFSGEMGAGKTTFIHHLCEHLNVEDAVSSPTFALINEYHFKDNGQNDRTIYHMDWYRIKDNAEAINAGIEDIMQQAKEEKTYCFIEWPEKAQALLPYPHLWITIAQANEAMPEGNKRIITCTLHNA